MRSEHDVIDGVNTFWFDTGRPTIQASLIFRVGMADETLPMSGWVHLIEHLAAHDLEQPTLDVSASTGLLDTRFDFTGPPALVARALSELTAWLSYPDFAELEREANVLRAESEWRGSNPAARALLQRYGAGGPGLRGYPEPGLWRVNADELRDVCAVAFTAGNAVLSVNGALPEGLHLHLRPGEWIPPDPAIEVPDARPLAYVVPDGVDVSGVVARTTAATMMPPLLHRTLREHLRDSEGAAYAPWTSYEPVDAERAIIICGSDVRADLLPRLVEVTRAALWRIRDYSWTSAALAEQVARAEQAFADPLHHAVVAEINAKAYLHGLPLQDLEEFVEGHRSITPADIVEVLDEFESSLILGIPGETPWNDELPMARMPVSPALPGKRFPSGNHPADRSVLTVGDAGVSLGQGDEHLTLGIGQLAGMVARADGGRELVRRDGWVITVEPTLWRGGPAAVAQIDAVVPPALVMPFPPRDPAQIPQPLGLWTRLWTARRGR